MWFGSSSSAARFPARNEGLHPMRAARLTKGPGRRSRSSGQPTIERKIRMFLLGLPLCQFTSSKPTSKQPVDSVRYLFTSRSVYWRGPHSLICWNLTDSTVVVSAVIMVPYNKQSTGCLNNTSYLVVMGNHKGTNYEPSRTLEFVEQFHDG